MTAAEISSKEKWELSNDSLIHILKNEIHLMREVLSNLHQEEFALLENNRRSWNKILSHRSDLIVDLSHERNRRMEATAELTKWAVLYNQKELASWEVLSKLDQITALIEKSNLQNCRNETLFQETKHRQQSQTFCPFPHPLHKARRRSRIATSTKKE